MQNNDTYIRTFENLMFVESDEYIKVEGYETVGHASHLSENNCRALLPDYGGLYRWYEHRGNQWLPSAKDSLNTLLRYLEFPKNTIVLKKI